VCVDVSSSQPSDSGREGELEILLALGFSKEGMATHLAYSKAKRKDICEKHLGRSTAEYGAM
jgi:hypothetical protein